MFYILYQVTNNLNGKIYVGVHKTKSLDDGYMGSGKVINSAIAKYGVENFTRVILEQFDDSAAMYAREKEVVTEEFLAREDTYNLRRGGFGGFDYINSAGLAMDFRAIKLNDPARHMDISAAAGRKGGKRLAELGTGIHDPKHRHSGWIDDAHKSKAQTAALLPVAKAKRRATFAAIGHSQGAKNSQFGSKWITDEVSNKKIKKDDLVPEGWRAGRKIKV